MAILLEGKGRLRFIIGIAGRYNQSAGRCPHRNDPLFHGTLREDQADTGPICSRFAIRRVVHLKNQNRPGLYELRSTWRQRQRRHPGRPSYEHPIDLAVAPGYLVFALRLTSLLAPGPRTLSRFTHVYYDMMDQAAIALLDLGELDVAVLREVSRHRKIFVRNDAVGRNAVFLIHRENKIRLANSPAFRKRGIRTQIFGISLFGSAIHPGNEGVDLFLRQPAIVGEFPMAGVREPRWHAALHDDVPDRFRPGPDLVISQ